MKNKLCHILLGILFGFSFINVVFADEYQVYVSATPSATEVLEGEEVSIILKVKSDSPVNDCQIQVSSDSSVEFVSMHEVGTSWQYTGKVNDFTIADRNFSSEPLVNGTDIIKIIYRVNGSGSINVKTVACGYAVSDDESYEDSQIEQQVVNFKTKSLSEVTTLDSLMVTKGGTMTESFSSDKKGTYFIELNSLTFGLEWKTTNPDYQNNVKVINFDTDEEINDPKNITFESNGTTGMPILVVVSDNNGNSTTYTLVAQMSEQVEYDNTLKSITINGKKITLIDGRFENGGYNYEYTVESDVTSVTIEAELSDGENFKFSDKGNAPATFTIDDIVNVEIYTEPINSSVDALGQGYKIQINRKVDTTTKPGDEGDKPNTGGTTGGNSSSGGVTGGDSGNDGSSGNTNYNPDTGGVSMYVMAIILISSLVGSIVLYQKNLNAYK